jgi:hypothetical protein
MPGALRFAEGAEKNEQSGRGWPTGRTPESERLVKSADRNYSENKVQAQYFEGAVPNAITPPTKAPASLRLSSMSPSS